MGTTSPSGIQPFQPASAKLRALRRWYPMTPGAALNALQRIRPSYPLIEGGRKSGRNWPAYRSTGGSAA